MNLTWERMVFKMNFSHCSWFSSDIDANPEGAAPQPAGWSAGLWEWEDDDNGAADEQPIAAAKGGTAEAGAASERIALSMLSIL